MVSLLIVAMGLAITPHSNAETVFFGKGGLTNLVVDVPAGKMMIVRASSMTRGVSISGSGGTWIPSSMDSPGFATIFQPRYLAGPCTFTCNANDSVFSYDVVPANGIQTFMGRDPWPTPHTNKWVIQVPSGKRLRLLDGDYPLRFKVILTNGASNVININRSSSNIGVSPTYGPDGFELAGPLAVEFNCPECFGTTGAFFVTYFLASDVAETVGQAIQSPVGSIVTVEKSTDLQTWYPAYVTTEKSSPKAFYRLSVGR